MVRGPRKFREGLLRHLLLLILREGTLCLGTIQKLQTKGGLAGSEGITNDENVVRNDC